MNKIALLIMSVALLFSASCSKKTLIEVTNASGNAIQIEIDDMPHILNRGQSAAYNYLNDRFLITRGSIGYRYEWRAIDSKEFIYKKSFNNKLYISIQEGMEIYVMRQDGGIWTPQPKGFPLKPLVE